mmetsp:Transcript_40432/g.126136  ORF Transcript_40432/g.126136 Transcript_40432/m.126136 type:complete len:320 (-) Transcript_40432:78-1037(-)
MPSFLQTLLEVPHSRPRRAQGLFRLCCPPAVELPLLLGSTEVLLCFTAHLALAAQLLTPGPLLPECGLDALRVALQVAAALSQGGLLLPQACRQLPVRPQVLQEPVVLDGIPLRPSANLAVRMQRLGTCEEVLEVPLRLPGLHQLQGRWRYVAGLVPALHLAVELLLHRPRLLVQVLVDLLHAEDALVAKQVRQSVPVGAIRDLRQRRLGVHAWHCHRPKADAAIAKEVVPDHVGAESAVVAALLQGMRDGVQGRGSRQRRRLGTHEAAVQAGVHDLRGCPLAGSALSGQTRQGPAAPAVMRLRAEAGEEAQPGWVMDA